MRRTPRNILSFDFTPRSIMVVKIFLMSSYNAEADKEATLEGNIFISVHFGGNKIITFICDDHVRLTIA